MAKKETSHWWLFDSHNSSRRSPWLQSTLAELDAKMKAMLKLMDEDADSFALRAEMYYKKRPELISMVEDFYRAHRSLAERYDQAKSDHGTRVLTTLGSPFSSTKYCSEKLTSVMDQNYDSYSETSESEECAQSEVEDPEEEDEIHVAKESKEAKDFEHDNGSQFEEEIKEHKVPSVVRDDEVMKLREEIERLKEENETQKEQLMQKDEEKREVITQLSLANDEVVKLREKIERLEEENKTQKEQVVQKDEEKRKVITQVSLADDEVMKLRKEIERLKEEIKTQKEQLMQKDAEKREVITQLSLAVELLKDDNLKMRKCIAKDSAKKWSPFEFSKLREGFFGKLFNGCPKPRTSILAP